MPPAPCISTMSPREQHPFYLCPHDRSSLQISAGSASCLVCRSTFPIQDQIVLLDSIKRADRKAFDQAASSVQHLTAEQRRAGVKKAEALLPMAEIETLRAGAILDIGCGFGDLTYGLASSYRIKDCDIYAIDHSIDSLHVLLASVFPQQGNRIHVSTQDASALCLPEGSLDLVFGSAVLHHILDYRALLKSVYLTLKPRGKAIFMEPFLHGYLIASLFLAAAVNELGLTDTDLRKPQFGMCRFLIDDTAYRLQHENELSALDHLADKHYFREDCVSRLGYSLGFQRVSFVNYEQPEFYDDFMRHIMSVYGITDPGLIVAAARSYDILRKLAGKTLPDVISHFKYILFSK
jgi:ubiquinone/menaquinone biosynthesis C-methylase UbiE